MFTFFHPNRRWFLGGAGVVGSYVLERIDAPLWLAVLTLVILLSSAALWPWLEQKRPRTRMFWGALALYVVFTLIIVASYQKTTTTEVDTPTQPPPRAFSPATVDTTGVRSAPGVPALIMVVEKFPGQWPGYTNKDYVPLDDTAKFTMRVGQTQTTFPAIGSPAAGLSNIYFQICVPRRSFVVAKSPRWELADPQRADPDDWQDCDAYSTYISRTNPGQGINPRDPLKYQALAEGAFVFRYRVSAAETTGPAYGRFPVTVTP